MLHLPSRSPVPSIPPSNGPFLTLSLPLAFFSPSLSKVSVTSPVILQSPGRWMSQSTNGVI